MANVLITGGAGFIGSHLATRLVALGHRVRVFDNFATGRRENLAGLAGEIELLEGDLRDPQQCQAACDGIEFVFHQAALPSVPVSVERPRDAHDSNILGTFNLLLAARDARCRRVIYAGSSSAYGDSEISPKHEEICPAPKSPYAVQKLTGEHYCRAFYECWGLETLTIRYFNVFGPRQDPQSHYAAAIPAFVTAIIADRPPTVYGDGEQTRDFTYIDNVVHGNLLAMQAKQTRGDVVNVACGESISVNRVISRVSALLGKQVRPRYAPPRAGDVRHSEADIRRARSLLGYEAQVDFDEGLKRAIDYYVSLARAAERL
jgi:nucleoside-diphosphate-sugar epimerase